MESIGVYWTPLKPDLVGIVTLEVDRVIEKTFALHSQASDGDEDASKHLDLLKLSIQARIDDLDDFFKRHFADARVSFFEKQKFRLRKLLFDIGQSGQSAVARDLDLRVVGLREPPPKTQSKSPAPQKQPSRPGPETARDPKKAEPAKEAGGAEGVIYSIKLNKNEFNKIVEKKSKLRQVEANK